MTTDKGTTPGFKLQDEPSIICAMLPGRWLLQRVTPSWRIKDPQDGFQRMVREGRAREIALAVLDQRRTFPNAIVLATNSECVDTQSGRVNIPDDVRFLIVDGQHRLWAQNFSQFSASYACLIHVGLSVEQMAYLFLEINDNQKRVPSSLRWDLVRLVRPEDDPEATAASEIVYLLATEPDSPFFQRIDLTGEQSEMQIKQGSLAPEFKSLLSRRSPLRTYEFQRQYDIILEYSMAIREIDSDNWGLPQSAFFKARVLRAMFRLLSDIVSDLNKNHVALASAAMIPYLERIKEESLDPEKIRSVQGSAGMRAIYLSIKSQVFPTS